MGLAFTKMHGLGNDFVVLDGRGAPLQLDSAQVRAMANRHAGIGFDQLLVIEPPRSPDCIAAYAIRNADGSRAEQCGNGARCIGAWLHRDGTLDMGTDARLDSPAGKVAMRLLDPATVAVDMGEPVFEPARIAFLAPAESADEPLELDDDSVRIAAVSMGNPHAVVQVDDLADPRIERLGPAITAHPAFPQGANAGFVQVLHRGRVRLRVHERGAGWTLACGSGACAAVAALRRGDALDPVVEVELPGGVLTIEWPGPGHRLWMTGPASFAFDGTWLGTS